MRAELKALVDWPLSLRPPVPRRTPPFRAYCVERRANADVVNALAAQARDLHRWSLDVGAGMKFDLLARLVAQHPPRSSEEWLVFLDDDVTIVRGTLATFIGIAAALAFDVAQPGHDRRGYVNYGLTVSRPFTRARLTSFVEIGPIFAVGPRARLRVLETFAGSGMGFGLERVWYNLEPRPRFGVVDEVRMRHLNPSTGAYDADASIASGAATIERFGASADQPQETYRTWAAWQRIGRFARARASVRVRGRGSAE